MARKLELAPFCLAALACLFMSGAAHAQRRRSDLDPRKPQIVNVSNLRARQGDARRDVDPQDDRGPVSDELRMEHMFLQLRRSPDQERALQQFINELHTPSSPNFHRWITAQEFGQRFGVARQDLYTVTNWLKSNGFQVNLVYSGGMVIDFSGTARQVRQAFHTPIHHVIFKGERHIHNVNEPQVPAALAGAVVGVVSLNDVKPVALHKLHRQKPKTKGNFTFDSLGTTYAIVPGDLATIYNLNPVFASGNVGQGQTIVLIEDTNVYSAADWTTFRSTFGLSRYTTASFKTIHPGPSSGTNNCFNPGVVPPNDAEAILDAEWASAAAPGAALVMASCADTTTTFGGLIALENLINSNNPPPPIMSISYGQCETENGASANAAYYSAYQQAVAEGVSIFVAAGDSGAAACDNSVSQATHGIGANAFASTPFNVAVGGTDFSDTYSGTNNLYWNSTNTSSFASALSYIPEIPWNDSCAGQLVSNFEGYPTTYGTNSFCNSDIGAFLQTTVAGGGGPSGCATGSPSIAGVVSGSCAGWSKPSWQSVLGNPNDGVRDTPDVSLFAADGLWSHYYVFCWSDTANGGAACSGSPSGWSGAGGTSFASPIMAGVQALINKRAGSRQGNPNPELYHLAAVEYGANGSGCNSSNGTGVSSACIFYDITQGDMDVNCAGPNCYRPAGSTGVLSTSNQAFNPAYGTNVGWDFATGIGSINAANLVNAWPSTAPGFTLSAPSSMTVTQGNSVSGTIGVNEVNGFTGGVNLSVSGLPSGVTASFSPNPTMTSSVLTLTATSTAATGTVNLTVTGTSGNLTSSAPIALTVTIVGDFGLSALPSSVSVTQGQSGTSAINVTPQNGFVSSVSFSASSVPSGVTASFSPNPAATSSTLTLTATTTAPTGTFSMTVTGTVGGLTHSTVVSVTVNPRPTFTLSGSPSNVTLAQGLASTSTVSVMPLNGFNSSVSFSATGLPSGVTALFNPNPSGASATLTLMASSVAATGTATVTVTGTSGSVTASVPVTLTVVAATNFAPGWFDSDIGSTGLAGSAALSNGTFTVKGAGLQIWGTGDSFNFAYQPLSGDGSIVARVVSISPNSATPGIMIRDSLDPSAMSAFGAYFASNAYLNYRSSTGGNTGQSSAPAGILPYWLKLTRTGSTISAFTSPDGVNWTAIGTSQTISMGQNVYVGLVVCSNNTSTLATATFDNVSVNSAAAPAPVISSLSTTTGSVGSQVVISGTGFGSPQGNSLVTLNGSLTTVNSWSNTSITVTIPTAATSGPLSVLVAPTMNASNPVPFVVIATTGFSYGWLDADVGSTGLAGSASFSNGTFTVKGAGLQIWGSGDSFNFAYQILTGDGSIVARVTSVSPNSATPGIMIRDSLNPNAMSAFGAYFASNAYLNYRSTTGGSTSQSSATAGPLPYWLKLTRSGSNISAFTSPDGVNWMPIGTSQTINMGQNVYVGLVLCSNNTSTLATATFDNVSVNSAAAPAPVISSLSTMSASVGSQVVISGTGFGSTQGNSIVTLNGALVPVNSWSDTSLTVTIPAGATSGPLAVLVAPAMDASNAVPFTVTAAAPPAFILSASPTSVSIAQGASGTSTITINPQNGFSGGVSFSATGLPSGVTASFSPNPATASSTLTLTASSTAATGTSTVTVTGTSGSLSNSATVSLTVSAGPNFTLSASPSSVSVTQGSSTTTTISIGAQNGFNSGVTLSASGLPGGVSASFSPNPATGSSTLTLTASSTATAGTATVTVTGTSGSLTNFTAVVLTVTVNTALPSLWSDGDVGTTGLAGSASFSNGTFTVKGAGLQIWGTGDSFNFAYQILSGDGSIVARVTSVSPNSATPGIMIRDSLNPNAMSAFGAYFASNSYLNYRSTTGGNTSQSSAVAGPLPYWLKLTRSGSSISAFTSPDGVNWTPIGASQTINMSPSVYVGLVVCSNSTSTLATATFDDVSVNSTTVPAPAISSVSANTGSIGNQVVISGSGFGSAQSTSIVTLNGVPVTVNSWSNTSVTVTIPAGATSGPLSVLVAPSMNASNPIPFTVTAQPLPTPWLDQDVGQVGIAGSATFSNGTFTVKGAGLQIWGTADSFNFAYQPLSGDATIIARVASISPNSATPGIMIRDSLNPNAMSAFGAYFASNAYLNYRSTTGGNTSQSSATAGPLPYWLKLVRSGSVISAFTSADGVNWMPIGPSQTINMGQTIYVGLVVCSNSTATLATATFDNVTVASP